MKALNVRFEAYRTVLRTGLNFQISPTGSAAAGAAFSAT